MVRRSGSIAWSLVMALALLGTVMSRPAAAAGANEKLLIPVGHAQVVILDEPVKTVAIAEPRIADAAVGSERSVVVNGKKVGGTSLVVYGDGGRFRVYDIDVFEPNADKQVLLKVQVAEVTANASKELGIDVGGGGQLGTKNHTDFIDGGLFSTKVSSPSLPLSLGPKTDGAIEFDRDNGRTFFQATWRALQEKGDIRLLASPTLVARSGDSASFLAGGEFPIPVANSASNTAITVTIVWKEFGVKVNFTPTVDSDGGITLNVRPEVSQLDFANGELLNGFNIPTVNVRRASTTVHLNPGENLVIGGLKQTDHNKTVRKVPILGDIPLLNIFFKTTRTEDVERNLVIVVSPELIEGGSTTMPALPTDTIKKK